MKTVVKILSAKYIERYKLEISFSDGKVNIFDYENLVMNEHEENLLYREIEKFKRFDIISDTEIAWGDDWHMILPLHTIYSKKKI